MTVGPRVLLMEDQEVLLALLEELLTDDGIAVTVSRSLAETYAAAASGAIAVAVVDSWGASHETLEPAERQQIQHLAQLVPTVLVSGRVWARHVTAQELGRGAPAQAV